MVGQQRTEQKAAADLESLLWEEEQLSRPRQPWAGLPVGWIPFGLLDRIWPRLHSRKRSIKRIRRASTSPSHLAVKIMNQRNPKSQIDSLSNSAAAKRCFLVPSLGDFNLWPMAWQSASSGVHR